MDNKTKWIVGGGVAAAALYLFTRGPKTPPKDAPVLANDGKVKTPDAVQMPEATPKGAAEATAQKEVAQTTVQKMTMVENKASAEADEKRAQADAAVAQVEATKNDPPAQAQAAVEAQVAVAESAQAAAVADQVAVEKATAEATAATATKVEEAVVAAVEQKAPVVAPAATPQEPAKVIPPPAVPPAPPAAAGPAPTVPMPVKPAVVVQPTPAATNGNKPVPVPVTTVPIVPPTAKPPATSNVAAATALDGALRMMAGKASLGALPMSEFAEVVTALYTATAARFGAGPRDFPVPAPVIQGARAQIEAELDKRINTDPKGIKLLTDIKAAPLAKLLELEAKYNSAFTAWRMEMAKAMAMRKTPPARPTLDGELLLSQKYWKAELARKRMPTPMVRPAVMAPAATALPAPAPRPAAGKPSPAASVRPAVMALRGFDWIS